jgi:hypothetical protein
VVATATESSSVLSSVISTRCRCVAFAETNTFTVPDELSLCFLLLKGFNINTWRPKCRCKHSHNEHAPPGMPYQRCAAPGCGCGHFQSDFLCVVCDQHWEDHETVTETEAERKSSGKTIRSEYFPLAGVCPSPHNAPQQPRSSCIESAVSLFAWCCNHCISLLCACLQTRPTYRRLFLEPRRHR